MPWAAAVGAIGSVAGGLISAGAAGSAAGVQANAANNAANQQMQMFQLIQRNLAPYMNLGTNAINTLFGPANIGSSAATGGAPAGASPVSFGVPNGPMLNNPAAAPVGATGTSSGLGVGALAPSGVTSPTVFDTLTARFAPTQAQLEQTPGYQFSLSQGLGAVQNSQAAAGMGRSGNALKGAADYATGLASTTYQQQLQNYLTQNSQIYNMLTGLIGTGENAAAGVGNAGMGITNSISQLLTGGAAATAGGIVGGANALSGAFSGAGSNALLGLLLNQNNPSTNNLSSSAAGGGSGLFAGAGGGAIYPSQ